MEKEYFELKAEHLKLLKESYVLWSNCEFGAAGIDPKRPYGSSDVEDDLANILGDLPEETLLKLHEETEIALQICLSTQSFEPGKYVLVWGEKWARIEEK